MARLLLVDDDPAQINVLRLLLERDGHQIETAETLSCAVEKLSPAGPDVLLMDLRLPDLRAGLALIRKAHETSPAKILGLSGLAAATWNRCPNNSSCIGVLAKPVRPNTLRRLIERTRGEVGGRLRNLPGPVVIFRRAWTVILSATSALAPRNFAARAFFASADQITSPSLLTRRTDA